MVLELRANNCITTLCLLHSRKLWLKIYWKSVSLIPCSSMVIIYGYAIKKVINATKWCHSYSITLCAATFLKNHWKQSGLAYHLHTMQKKCRQNLDLDPPPPFCTPNFFQWKKEKLISYTRNPTPGYTQHVCYIPQLFSKSSFLRFSVPSRKKVFSSTPRIS